MALRVVGHAKRNGKLAKNFTNGNFRSAVAEMNNFSESVFFLVFCSIIFDMARAIKNKQQATQQVLLARMCVCVCRDSLLAKMAAALAATRAKSKPM